MTIDVDGRERQQDLPAEAHQLVVAQPGQRGADPDEDEDQRQDLGDHPDRVEEARARAHPAAEEEGHGDGRDHEHLQVLGQQVGAEAHPAVLGLVALDQLGVRLGQVERRAVGLSEARDHEDQEADELGHDVPEVALRLDDRRKRQRPGHHHDADQRQAHRHLVGDQLGGRAHRAQEAVLRPRGPAREQQAVERERAEGEEVEDADRDVDPVEADPVLDVAEGDDRQRHDAREDHDGWSDREEQRHRGVWAELLLAGELHDVGERLHHPERAHAVRAVAVLEAPDQLALDHGQHRHDQEDAEEDDQRLHDHDPGGLGETDLGDEVHERRAHAEPISSALRRSASGSRPAWRGRSRSRARSRSGRREARAWRLRCGGARRSARTLPLSSLVPSIRKAPPGRIRDLTLANASMETPSAGDGDGSPCSRFRAFASSGWSSSRCVGIKKRKEGLRSVTSEAQRSR